MQIYSGIVLLSIRSILSAKVLFHVLTRFHYGHVTAWDPSVLWMAVLLLDALARQDGMVEV